MVLLIASLKSFGGDDVTPEALHENQIQRIRWLFSQTAGQLKTELRQHFEVSDHTLGAIALFVQYRNEFVHNLPVHIPMEGDEDDTAIRFYQYCELVDAAAFAAMGSLSAIEPKKNRDAGATGILAMKNFLNETRSIAINSDTLTAVSFVPFLNFRGY